MKTRALIGASLVGLVAMTTAGWSCGGPCPDLEIACPDLDCPNGYKVDHNSCAICECVGDVDPEPIACFDDADCPRGFVCELPDDLYMPCEPGMDYCGMPAIEGVCVEIEQPQDCSQLDEQACIEAENCEPLYAYPVGDGSSPDCWDCGGGFVGCVERYEPTCTSDRDCEPGFVCMDGMCVWDYKPYECYSDYDCPEGYFCAYDYNGGPAPGQEEGGDALIAMGGFCLPREEQRCAGLGEQACIERPDCEPVYETYPCDCVGGDCACPDMMFFAYCTEASYGGECYSDADCPAGMICVFPGWACPEGADCAAPYYEGGSCVVDPTDPQTCYSDYDCGEGFHCEYYDYGSGQRPECPEGEACDPIAPPMGVCMPDESPSECYSDYDCPEGTSCVVETREYCEVTANGEVVCYVEQSIGQCLPVETPDTYCFSDADCGDNAYCNYDAGCAGQAPNPDDPTSDAPALRACGVCVER